MLLAPSWIGGTEQRPAPARTDALASCQLRCYLRVSPGPPSSSGLGRRPLTAETGVRVPLGVPSAGISFRVKALFQGVAGRCGRRIHGSAAPNQPLSTARAGVSQVLLRPHGPELISAAVGRQVLVRLNQFNREPQGGRWPLTIRPSAQPHTAPLGSHRDSYLPAADRHVLLAQIFARETGIAETWLFSPPFRMAAGAVEPVKGHESE